MCEMCTSAMFGIPYGWQIDSFCLSPTSSNEKRCVVLRLILDNRDETASLDCVSVLLEDINHLKAAEALAHSLGGEGPVKLFPIIHVDDSPKT